MTLDSSAFNAIIVNLNRDYQRDAIIRLIKDNFITAKLWFGFSDNAGVYNGIEIISSDKLLNCPMKNFPTCAEELYNKVHQRLQTFVSVEERWEQTIEPYNYVHKFNIWLRYWYHYLNKEKINLIIFGIIPHSGIDYVLYLTAKAMNITTIVCKAVVGTDRFIATHSIEAYGTMDIKNYGAEVEVKLEKSFHKKLSYTKDYKQPNPIPIKPHNTVQIMNVLMRKLSNFKLNYRRLNEKIISFLALFSYKVINMKLENDFYYKKKSVNCKMPNKTEKYVYFPLHLQPELNIECLGGIYDDQLLAVERLSALLPDYYKIYVKDYPKQSYYKRSDLFFRRLFSIDKVELVPYQADTYELMKHCQFVATITGTAGWEAISGGKNVLIFGYAWYRTLPGVFEYSDGFNINKILQYKINHAELTNAYQNLISAMFEGKIGNQHKEVDFPEGMEKNIEQLYGSFKKIIGMLREAAL